MREKGLLDMCIGLLALVIPPTALQILTLKCMYDLFHTRLSNNKMAKKLNDYFSKN